MRRPPVLLAALAAASALAAVVAAQPAQDPGGGAIPVPAATANDATADVVTWAAPNNGAEPATAAGAVSSNAVVRGRYLVDAGDCRSCHSNSGGAAFAGARPIGTPFGTIYSSNITPDMKTGIGAWTDEDFYRALHTGVRPNGQRLYPAFPYPHFTELTRTDSDALHAYLRTLPAVSQVKPANKLPFPLNIRFLLRIWNALYFRPGTFQPDPGRTEAWNRGAYLVQGPGHCGACHTAMNFLGAEERDKAFQGGKLDGWVTLNLTNGGGDGLASWSQSDVAEYLRTGRNSRTSASGSMGEVIYQSTSRMSDADLAAIANYLKALPGGRTEAQATADAVTLRAGQAVYVDLCAACHKGSGEGTPRLFPPLKGDASLQARDPTTIVRLILNGSRSVPTPGRPTPLAMPAFGWKLTDQQIASVATYVRSNWGSNAPAVDASQVTQLRHRYGEQAVR